MSAEQQSSAEAASGGGARCRSMSSSSKPATENTDVAKMPFPELLDVLPGILTESDELQKLLAAINQCVSRTTQNELRKLCKAWGVPQYNRTTKDMLHDVEQKIRENVKQLLLSSSKPTSKIMPSTMPVAELLQYLPNNVTESEDLHKLLVDIRAFLDRA